MWEQQELETLYRALYHRKSVRKFTPEPLGDEEMRRLGKATHKTVPLTQGAGVAFRVLEPAHLKGMISAKAPHYLAVYAGPEEEAQINAAFQLQQVDLWLSAQGLGSCWLGMPNPVPEAAKAAGLEFVVALAFGNPAEAVHRSGASEFKRKTMGEISNIDVAALEELLEPVRLAPSGTNRQPWYLTRGEAAIHLHGKRNGPLTKMLFGDRPALDLGIALCHLWLAAQEEGLLDKMAQVEGVSSPAGYRYVWSMLCKETL